MINNGNFQKRDFQRFAENPFKWTEINRVVSRDEEISNLEKKEILQTSQNSRQRTTAFSVKNLPTKQLLILIKLRTQANGKE